MVAIHVYPFDAVRNIPEKTQALICGNRRWAMRAVVTESEICPALRQRIEMRPPRPARPGRHSTPGPGDRGAKPRLLHVRLQHERGNLVDHRQSLVRRLR